MAIIGNTAIKEIGTRIDRVMVFEWDTGELEMPQTGTENGSPVARLFNGATALISSAVFRG